MATHQKLLKPIRTTNRSIWIYGNPDKSDLGFASPGNLTDYIRNDIFAYEDGHYRYTQGKNADVIVLSREGLAYGHFEVSEKIRPTKADRRAYPRVKFVYLVRTSTLYAHPVLLSKLSLSKIRWGRKITEGEFLEIQRLAGGTEDFYSPKALPQSTLELEKALQEVRLRLGQSDFRRELIAAYRSRCAVTGCNVLEALEAAHIDPYSGISSNHPSNGLLLRADIHTLFDLDLLGIDPTTLTISLGAVLKNTCYSDLEGKLLASPRSAAARPNAKALMARWEKFSTK